MEAGEEKKLKSSLNLSALSNKVVCSDTDIILVSTVRLSCRVWGSVPRIWRTPRVWGGCPRVNVPFITLLFMYVNKVDIHALSMLNIPHK